MGANSKIEWTDHTFNAWVGCAKVGPGCDRCYAEAWAKRSGLVGWGPAAPRRRTSPATWHMPTKWDRAAERSRVRHRVFCNSLADVFDNAVPATWRADLFALILETPNLDWILVTKRIGNAAEMLPADWGLGYPNVWMIATVCTQPEAERDVPKLLAIPAAVHGVSVEPILGPVELAPYLSGHEENGVVLGRPVGTCVAYTPPLDWVIVGGESGGGARPCDLAWIESIVADCRAADVPAFVKQLGSNPHILGQSLASKRGPNYDRKGGDIDNWPRRLRVREFPVTAA